MSNLQLPICLLAVAGDRERLQEMGAAFRDKKEQYNGVELVYWIGLAIVLLAGLAALARWLSRHDRRSLFSSPRSLFNHLCATHGLDRASRRLLKQLSKAFGLGHAARIFLEPRCFDPAGLPPALASSASAISKLHARLFGPADRRDA